MKNIQLHEIFYKHKLTPQTHSQVNLAISRSTSSVYYYILRVNFGRNKIQTNARKAINAPNANGAEGETRFHKKPANKLAGNAMIPTDAL